MDSRDISIMTYTDVMDKSFNIHKKHLGASALYLFIFYIITLLSSFLLIFFGVLSFGFMAFNFYSKFPIDYLDGDMNLKSIIVFSLIIISILFLFFLFKFIKEAGIIDIASRGFLDKRVKFEKAIGQAFKKIPSILSVMIAYGLIFVPMTLVFISLVFVLGLTGNIDQFNIWIFLLGLGFFIIYMYLITIYMFSIHAAVIEKLYFFKALKRSRRLVKGCFWRLLGINILFSIVVLAITYSIYSIIGIVAGLIYIILKGINIEENTLMALIMAGNFLRLPLQILFSLFISPLTGIFLTVLYYNQRFKKEGYDIELKLEKLKETDKIMKEKKSETSNIFIGSSNERKI